MFGPGLPGADASDHGLVKFGSFNIPVELALEVVKLPRVSKRISGQFIKFSILCLHAGYQQMAKKLSSGASLGISDEITGVDGKRLSMDSLGSAYSVGNDLELLKFKLKLILQNAQRQHMTKRITEAVRAGRGVFSHLELDGTPCLVRYSFLEDDGTAKTWGRRSMELLGFVRCVSWGTSDGKTLVADVSFTMGRLWQTTDLRAMERGHKTHQIYEELRQECQHVRDLCEEPDSMIRTFSLSHYVVDGAVKSVLTNCVPLIHRITKSLRDLYITDACFTHDLHGAFEDACPELSSDATKKNLRRVIWSLYDGKQILLDQCTEWMELNYMQVKKENLAPYDYSEFADLERPDLIDRLNAAQLRYVGEFLFGCVTLAEATRVIRELISLLKVVTLSRFGEVCAPAASLCLCNMVGIIPELIDYSLQHSQKRYALTRARTKEDEYDILDVIRICWVVSRLRSFEYILRHVLADSSIASLERIDMPALVKSRHSFQKLLHRRDRKRLRGHSDQDLHKVGAALDALTTRIFLAIRRKLESPPHCFLTLGLLDPEEYTVEHMLDRISRYKGRLDEGFSAPLKELWEANKILPEDMLSLSDCCNCMRRSPLCTMAQERVHSVTAKVVRSQHGLLSAGTVNVQQWCERHTTCNNLKDYQQTEYAVSYDELAKEVNVSNCRLRVHTEKRGEIIKSKSITFEEVQKIKNVSAQSIPMIEKLRLEYKLRDKKNRNQLAAIDENHENAKEDRKRAEAIIALKNSFPMKNTETIPVSAEHVMSGLRSMTDVRIKELANNLTRQAPDFVMQEDDWTPSMPPHMSLSPLISAPIALILRAAAKYGKAYVMGRVYAYFPDSVSDSSPRAFRINFVNLSPYVLFVERLNISNDPHDMNVCILGKSGEFLELSAMEPGHGFLITPTKDEGTHLIIETQITRFKHDVARMENLRRTLKNDAAKDIKRDTTNTDENNFFCLRTVDEERYRRAIGRQRTIENYTAERENLTPERQEQLANDLASARESMSAFMAENLSDFKLVTRGGGWTVQHHDVSIDVFRSEPITGKARKFLKRCNLKEGGKDFRVTVFKDHKGGCQFYSSVLQFLLDHGATGEEASPTESPWSVASRLYFDEMFADRLKSWRSSERSAFEEARVDMRQHWDRFFWICEKTSFSQEFSKQGDVLDLDDVEDA